MAPNHFFFLFEFVFEAEAGIAPDPGKLELSNWPIQMRLATVDAPYFDGARLLIAGDCTAFVKQALKIAGKEVPVRSFILGIEGEVQG